MNSVEKNLGFIFNNRWLDAALTFACLALTGLGIMMNDDVMVVFSVPAGMGLFRQCVPLLTFPFVVSIFFSGLMVADSAGLFEGIYSIVATL